MFLGCFCTAIGEEVTFRFSPPDNALIIIKTRRESIEMRLGMNEPAKDIRYSTYETRVNKTQRGYETVLLETM